MYHILKKYDSDHEGTELYEILKEAGSKNKKIKPSAGELEKARQNLTCILGIIHICPKAVCTFMNCKTIFQIVSV